MKKLTGKAVQEKQTEYDFDRVIDRRGTRSAKWQNPDLLPLWVADMDFESPQAVRDAIMKRASHNLYGYDQMPENYFDTVKNWFAKRQNFKIKEEWLVPTSGVVEALHLTIHSLTLPGDAVLIQPPVYHPFARSILRSGRQLVNNPLKRIDEHYEVDFEDLDAKLSNPLVKLLILCNPHNPVGKVFTREELTEIGNLALKHNVPVVSDEIHGDLIMSGYRHIPFASINEQFEQNCVICTAPSKTFNLAGLGTSNIFIPNSKLRNQFERFSQSLGLHGGTLYGFIACEAAYRTGEKWLDGVLDYIKENSVFLKKYLADNAPYIRAFDLQGTYLQWLDFRALGLEDEELEIFLRDKAKLWLSQGYIFGREGSGFVRVNIAAQRATLEKALDQLVSALKTHGHSP